MLFKAARIFARSVRQSAKFAPAALLLVTWPAHAVQASPTNIFAPASTPADAIYKLSLFVLAITAAIFVVVFTLLAYAAIKFRRCKDDDNREPPQVYGSTQVELAWTVIPVLIVVVLFLTSARVIHAIQDAHQPKNAIEVTAIGHQFWWEYRYPQYGIVTANELHIPVSDAKDPSPTFLTLLSSDTDHSFWVPRLAGKTDLIPNRANHMWIDPEQPGLYLGQCAQYCGTQHAKMLLRVYVESRADFERWVKQQQTPVAADAAVQQGREIFENTACVNCHRVAGTAARGGFGPDLTHFAGRETLAAGAAPNDRSDVWLWIKNPNAIKPGALMPAMNLSDRELDAVTAYLMTLR